MSDTYLPWFAGYWCAPFNWFSDGKLRRAGVHGLAAYHAIRHICDDRGLKLPCDIDEVHVEPAALVRATGGGIGAMTRAYERLLESGLLSRTVTSQIRVLESTPQSPAARRKEASRKKAESQGSHRDSHGTVTGQSRDSHGRSETEIRDPRAESDQEHASHDVPAAPVTPEPWQLQAQLAESTTVIQDPKKTKRTSVKKPRKGYTPTAVAIRTDWCERMGVPFDEDRRVMLAIQACLADGISPERLLLANIGDTERQKRNGTRFSQAGFLQGDFLEPRIADGEQIVEQRRVAHDLDVAAGRVPAADMRSRIADAFGVDAEKVKVN